MALKFNTKFDSEQHEIARLSRIICDLGLYINELYEYLKNAGEYPRYCTNYTDVKEIFNSVKDNRILYDDSENKKFFPFKCNRCGCRHISYSTICHQSVAGDYEDPKCPICYNVVDDDINTMIFHTDME